MLVVTTNGTVALAPGLMAPVKVTVNPVTGSQAAGGAGSVFTVVVVCGSAG